MLPVSQGQLYQSKVMQHNKPLAIRVIVNLLIGCGLAQPWREGISADTQRNRPNIDTPA
jgi:hypothetical protein